MSALGTQIIADFHECSAAALDDETLIRDAMLEAARRCGATVVTHCLHRFSPQGISGVVVIAESHLSIHTWPERGYAAVDLFTCGARLRSEVALEHLAEALGSRRVHIRALFRGDAQTEKSITLLDANDAPAHSEGAIAIARLSARLRRRAALRTVRLSDPALTPSAIAEIVARSDGFVFATGICQDSWGAPLQRFFERAPLLNGGPVWLGKPAGVLVTTDDVGAMGVLSRLQGTLAALGCLIPPMSGVVHARSPGPRSCPDSPHAEGHDIEILAHNLAEAVSGGCEWRSSSLAERSDAALQWAAQ